MASFSDEHAMLLENIASSSQSQLFSPLPGMGTPPSTSISAYSTRFAQGQRRRFHVEVETKQPTGHIETKLVLHATDEQMHAKRASRNHPLNPKYTGRPMMQPGTAMPPRFRQVLLQVLPVPPKT